MRTDAGSIALLVVGAFTAFYALVMGLMCLAGWWLARRTFGAAPVEVEIVAGRVSHSADELRLNWLYLATLLTGLVLFYAALPLVLTGMFGVFGLLLALALLTRSRQGESTFSLRLLRAGSGGVGAVFRSLFARGRQGRRGVRKRKEDCPRLFAAIEDVARRVETEPPDEVWIAPGANFSVCQEGRGPFGLFGTRRRVLTLGLCVFHVLTVGELKAILAHELAHFSHADTYWHRFVFQVTLSLRTGVREMVRTGGWVAWCNPFFWFFWAYSRSYDLLAAGFSRSREYLADRMACRLLGPEVFLEALRKVCTEGVHFERVIEGNIVRLARENRAFVNLYLAFRQHREAAPAEETRRRLHRELLAEQPSLLASHPTFRQRQQAVAGLPAARGREDDPALELFEEPGAVERELTDYLTGAILERVW